LATVPNACLPGLEQPTVLSSLDASYDPWALAAGPEMLYVGIGLSSSDVIGSVGIFGIVPGKAPQMIVAADGYESGPIFVAGGQLICRGYLDDPKAVGLVVEVRDLLTGAAEALVDPWGTWMVSDMAGNAAGDVFWAATNFDAQHFTLSRWRKGKTAQVFAQSSNASELFADNGAVYWRDIDAAQNVTFFAYNLKSGKQTTMRKSAWANDILPELRGIDDQALYFADVLTDAGGTVQGNEPVVAWSKTPGKGPLQAYADLTDVQRLFVVDSTHLYWVAQAAQDRLMRIAKHGNAAPEQVAQQDGHWVTAVATDACNVYWATENPPQVWVRRR